MKTTNRASLHFEKDGLSPPAPRKSEDAESANRFFIGMWQIYSVPLRAIL